MMRSALVYSSARRLQACRRSLSSASIVDSENRKTSLQALNESNPLFPWIETDDGKSIEKTFEFVDFNEAFSFMTRTALLAEQLNHHPEWSNVYNRVQVSLTTHDAGGITKNDLEMAEAMEMYAKQLMPSHDFTTT